MPAPPIPPERKPATCYCYCYCISFIFYIFSALPAAESKACPIWENKPINTFILLYINIIINIAVKISFVVERHVYFQPLFHNHRMFRLSCFLFYILNSDIFLLVCYGWITFKIDFSRWLLNDRCRNKYHIDRVCRIILFKQQLLFLRQHNRWDHELIIYSLVIFSRIFASTSRAFVCSEATLCSKLLWCFLYLLVLID